MQRTDAPVCLRQARDEMVLALSSLDSREERQHWRMANRLMTKAVRSITDEPEQNRDWSRLRLPHH